MQSTCPSYLAVVLTLALAPATPAQVRLLERGPELERLDRFVGEWEGELARELPGGRTLELTPVLAVDWAVGGTWLRGVERTTLPAGAVIHNVTTMTWHAGRERYVGAWLDNVSPGTVEFEGRWLDDRRLELDTGSFELAGRPHRVRFMYEFEDDDQFCTTMWQGWDDEAPTRVARSCFWRAGRRAEPDGAPPVPPVPDDAVDFGGHRYKVFDEVEGLSWSGARDACAAAGGTLAVVTSEREAAFIARLADDRYLFLGASDAEAEGRWSWVDGTPWEYTNWMKGQPNDYGGAEDYLATYDGGDWVDVEASGDDFWMPTGYVCEWGD